MCDEEAGLAQGLLPCCCSGLWLQVAEYGCQLPHKLVLSTICHTAIQPHTGEVLDSQPGAQGFQALATELQATLAADGEAAAAKLGDAMRALVNVCWLSELQVEYDDE